MAEVRIAVGGSRVDTDVESLWDWLREEPELRGRVQLRRIAINEGTMGFPVELVIMPTTAAIVSALARALSTWLLHRKSEVTVEISGRGDRKMQISAAGVADAEGLLDKVNEVLKEAFPDYGGPSDTSP